MIPVEKQINFYSWQLKEIEKEWKSYYTSSVKVLMQRKECFQGKLYGLDKKRGNLIIHFQKGNVPRLDMLYSLYNFTKLEELQASFLQFSRNVSGSSTGIKTIYNLGNDASGALIAVSGILLEDFDRFEDKKQLGEEVLFILGKPEPPINYLICLREFTRTNKNSSILNFSSTNDFSFNVRKFNSDKITTLQQKLDEKDLVIVQGPPGSGKSTLAANFVKDIHSDLKIGITAMTNQALIELAEKFKDSSLENKVYKSNLSRNEIKRCSFLKPHNQHNIPSSHILLTTFYNLSESVKDLRGPSPLYDLLIIEEASQAFYTTIVAFRWLAKKVLVIGDPQQLPPIVLNESSTAAIIHPKIDNLIYGMKTLMGMQKNPSFILHNTYRLNPYNTVLTNSFYKDILESNEDKRLTLDIAPAYQKYFDPSKPTQLWLEDSLSSPEDVKQLSSKLYPLLKSLKSPEKESLEIAILSTYKDDVSLLQENLGSLSQESENHILIETVDRVQGIDVDIVIFILRLGGSTRFVLNNNRFNVATSRARYYNLLITDVNYSFLLGTASQEVKKYFKRLTE